MNYKKTNAEKTTVSRDLYSLSNDVGNVYETIAILAKRSRQISVEMKEELLEKINEFSTGVDNVYKTDDGSYVVASPSIPSYNAQPIQSNQRKVIS